MIRNAAAHLLTFFQTDNPQEAPVLYQNSPQSDVAYPYQYYPAGVATAPMPGTLYWQGSTKAEVDMQNRAIHAATAQPRQLVPYKVENDEQFWCRELDGSYTLRTMKDIQDNLQPGVWQIGSSGYAYFVRESKEKQKD